MLVTSIDTIGLLHILVNCITISLVAIRSPEDRRDRRTRHGAVRAVTETIKATPSLGHPV